MQKPTLQEISLPRYAVTYPSKATTLSLIDEFSWEALTRAEQVIFTVLSTTGVALQVRTIYYRVAYVLLKEKIERKSKTDGKSRLCFYPMEPEKLSELSERLGNFADMSEPEREKTLVEFRRGGYESPAYITVSRILKDFASVGWVRVRHGNTRKIKLYYLSLEMKEIMKKEDHPSIQDISLLMSSPI